MRIAAQYCFIFLYVRCGFAVMNIHGNPTYIINRKVSACESCMEIEDCPSFQNMELRDQQIWKERYPCDRLPSGTTRIYEGFSSVAKGDKICCPQKNIWTIENGNNYRINRTSDDTEEHTKLSDPTKYSNNLDVRKNEQYTYRRKRNMSGNVKENRRARRQGVNPFFLKRALYPKQIAQDANIAGTSSEQCEVQTSLPPDPETGCCGLDMSDADRITDLENILPTLAPLISNKWEQYFLPRQGSKQANKNIPSKKIKRPIKNNTGEVNLESRIAGGSETELDQFPWTVLLSILFDFGGKTSVYSCGGSLISSRYVLTAGHCVYKQGARIAGLEITLAEYDKRTFPNDCVAVSGEGRECIQNIVIPAEDVIIHPLYEDAWLHNDIALIRLRSFAPYTRFIRPICLAPLDVDQPSLTNLPLSVAGWGRNREYLTSVKQSTVLNLIPQDQCKVYYPNLSKEHICAAGGSGEDTCKGDSGGPLMVLFRGRYYVMGVVSGKRSDSPCGTAVPSLFTSVFNYLDWIRGVIRNY